MQTYRDTEYLNKRKKLYFSKDCKCLQLEINGLYRWPKDELKFNSIIESLEEIITLISK